MLEHVRLFREQELQVKKKKETSASDQDSPPQAQPPANGREDPPEVTSDTSAN